MAKLLVSLRSKIRSGERMLAHRSVICRRDTSRIVRVRDVVRAVLVDRDRGVLLVQVNDADGHAAWALLGGEAEFGEDDRIAIARELREEIGMEDAAVGHFLWSREYVFPRDGEAVLWRERTYLVAADGLSVANANARWWSVAELSRHTEHFLPEELPQRLIDLLEAR
jgi:ADP-ribose pyrophosphatase YjhB (NUDIX family)